MLTAAAAGGRPPHISSVRGRCSSLRVRAAAANGSSIAEGATVKVVKPIKVFHVPKHAGGLSIEGMTGTVAKDVTQFKGKTLSANFKYRVQFDAERDGAPLKFSAHLDESEIEAV